MTGVTATGRRSRAGGYSGQMVVQISQLGEREGVFGVAEERVIRAVVGMPVRVWLQSDPSVLVHGAIREIAPQRRSDHRHLRGEDHLAQRTGCHAAGGGRRGAGRSEGPRDRSHSQQCPAAERRPARAVWIADRRDSAVHKRLVKVMRFDADSVAISEGLKDGELVVTAGINILVDGQKVTIPEMCRQPATQDAAQPASTPMRRRQSVGNGRSRRKTLVIFFMDRGTRCRRHVLPPVGT